MGGKVRDKNLRPEPHSPLPGAHPAAFPTGYSYLKTFTAASLRSGLSPSDPEETPTGVNVPEPTGNSWGGGGVCRRRGPGHQGWVWESEEEGTVQGSAAGLYLRSSTGLRSEHQDGGQGEVRGRRSEPGVSLWLLQREPWAPQTPAGAPRRSFLGQPEARTAAATLCRPRRRHPPPIFCPSLTTLP